MRVASPCNCDKAPAALGDREGGPCAPGAICAPIAPMVAATAELAEVTWVVVAVAIPLEPAVTRISRRARRDMRVTAGSSGIATATTTQVTSASSAVAATIGAMGAQIAPGAQGPPSLSPNAAGALSQLQGDATRMSTVQTTDFWAEVDYAIRAIVGTGAGRSIVISPQSGVVVVRAMPQELRSVETL